MVYHLGPVARITRNVRLRVKQLVLKYMCRV